MCSDFGAPRCHNFFAIRFFRTFTEREKNKIRLRHILAFLHSLVTCGMKTLLLILHDVKLCISEEQVFHFD